MICNKKKKIWRLADSGDRTAARLLANEFDLSLAAAKILASRGFDTPEAARSFLGRETEMLHDPFMMADMDKAAGRILKAIKNGEKIAVYGDYDVDGVTSTSVVFLYLRSLGCDIGYHIPNRIGEGYGVNAEAVKNFAADGVSLMITVDTGITAFDEIRLAAELGIDTVITDHHECRSELPSAFAVVDPRRHDCPYPFKELAGVGVAFKLICAVEMLRCDVGMAEATGRLAARFCDIVALGTIADVMPLIGENRIIVSYGLSMIEHTKNIGLFALMEASGLVTYDADGNRIKKKMTSSSVGFTLAPRINAAGRISSAEYALELLITDSKTRAEEIAAGLCDINRKRQAEENSIFEAAEEKMSAHSESDPVIVLDSDSWHHGVIGIVSSRITEKYDRPSILISFEDQSRKEPSPDDVGKGSGRSVNGLNLFEALEAVSPHLLKFGGHELAAGLSLERSKLDDFKKAINDYARKALAGKNLCRILDIDAKLYPEEINLRLVNDLYLLEPFGTGNAQPVFETDRLIITDVIPLAGGKHTKLTLAAAGADDRFTALMFGTPTEEFMYCSGDAVDLAYTLDINEFRGRQSVQLLVKDIRSSHTDTIPDRELFAKVYRYLKMMPAQSVKIGIYELCSAIGTDIDTLTAILDVFAELRIISIYRGEVFELNVLPVSGKIPLDSSLILTSLKKAL